MKAKTLGCLAAAFCLAMIFSLLGCSTFDGLGSDLAAVIFDAKNRLGVALTMTSLAWADENSLGYKMNFKTSSTSGADNWNVIKAADPAGTNTPEKCAKNYPAFNYCANYSTPGYKSGWYLPSTAELKMLMYYKYNVENALKRIPGAELINPSASKNAADYYWTSTQWVFKSDGNLANNFIAKF
ncbi:MAG: hypothetical protein J5817_10580 [Treponema sp.]|nr:hypothetical protein [Treponema sp.]